MLGSNQLSTLHYNVYFIYIFGSLWNVLECWLVLATDGVAHQWQHTTKQRHLVPTPTNIPFSINTPVCYYYVDS